MRRALGILGGLGPLASAEFIKTIYEVNIATSEQEAPICFMSSNPVVPKRSEAIAAGQDEALLSFLQESLLELLRMGSTKVAIACVTMHYLLPKLEDSLQKKVISLVDIVLQTVIQKKNKYLLLCSNGTRATRLFERHPQWRESQPYIVLPNGEEQDQIHHYFEEIKIGGSKEPIFQSINTMLEKYNVDGWIGACSELHILHKHSMEVKDTSQSQRIIDPLWILAKNINHFLQL